VVPDWPPDHVEIVKKCNNLILGWLSAEHVMGSMTDADDAKFINLMEIAFAISKYALRVANPRAADRPAGGWPPEWRIVMTIHSASA
jgi:hypothetical protein